MKALACKDVVANCEYVAKGDTTKEIFKNIVEHIRDKHHKFWLSIKNIPESDMEKEIIDKIKEAA
jgi:predicted small metal-binding protein